MRAVEGRYRIKEVHNKGGGRRYWIKEMQDKGGGREIQYKVGRKD